MVEPHLMGNGSYMIVRAHLLNEERVAGYRFIIVGNPFVRKDELFVLIYREAEPGMWGKAVNDG